ncbi:MAG TPA: hypothetical protein VHK69_10195 [Chitinophagaceae bacterium]|jgi:hypothetical protein|nr:hypothetical protein [Chitinophagaceae bacterium]
METLEQQRTAVPGREVPRPESLEQFEKRFRPVGAIAFFLALVVLGLAIWFGIYFLMLERV